MSLAFQMRPSYLQGPCKSSAIRSMSSDRGINPEPFNEPVEMELQMTWNGKIAGTRLDKFENNDDA